MAVKYRAITGPTCSGQVNGVKQKDVILPGGFERVETFSHDLSKLGSGTDVGGPFFLERSLYQYRPTTGVYNSNGSTRGDFIVSVPSTTAPTNPSTSKMNTDGATAIARSIPTNPVFNGATAIAEGVRDGLPALVGYQTWRDRSLTARAAGNEFLNYEFGWLPLVADIRDFAYAVQNHHKILTDFKKGSDKTTRVGYSFPSVQSTSVTTGSVFLSLAVNTGVSTTVPYSLTVQSETKNWFKGAFTYHVPASPTQLGKAAEYASYARKLLGLELTPETLWNAAPWTWAVDWFSNAGDVIHNVSRLGRDGLVLRYGYMMSSTSKRESIQTSPTQRSDFPIIRYGSASTTRIREFKRRLPANPYGFGVTNESLSAIQVAVLAALGVTRGSGRPG